MNKLSMHITIFSLVGNMVFGVDNFVVRTRFFVFWKNIRILALFILASAAVTDAAARCSKGGKEIFSCITREKKQIQLCDKGITMEYSFGKLGKPPEMALSIPRSAASTAQWRGWGGVMDYSIRIPNEGATYEVFTETYKSTFQRKAGVNVYLKNGKSVQILCAGDVENVGVGMEGIDLPSEN